MAMLVADYRSADYGTSSWTRLAPVVRHGGTADAEKRQGPVCLLLVLLLLLLLPGLLLLLPPLLLLLLLCLYLLFFYFFLFFFLV